MKQEIADAFHAGLSPSDRTRWLLSSVGEEDYCDDDVAFVEEEEKRPESWWWRREGEIIAE